MRPLLIETVTGPTMADLRSARDRSRDADLVELRLDGVADLDVDAVDEEIRVETRPRDEREDVTGRGLDRDQRAAPRAEAPKVLTMSFGLTTLPLDLDIFSPPSARIRPWDVRFLYGSEKGTAPISNRNLFQNLE